MAEKKKCLDCIKFYNCCSGDRIIRNVSPYNCSDYEPKEDWQPLDINNVPGDLFSGAWDMEMLHKTTNDWSVIYLTKKHEVHLYRDITYRIRKHKKTVDELADEYSEDFIDYKMGKAVGLRNLLEDAYIAGHKAGQDDS